METIERALLRRTEALLVLQQEYFRTRNRDTLGECRRQEEALLTDVRTFLRSPPGRPAEADTTAARLALGAAQQKAAELLGLLGNAKLCGALGLAPTKK